MKKKLRILLNMIIVIAVFAAWLGMALRGSGLLSGSGLRNLKYFTVLSNLMEGIVCIVWLASLRKESHQGAERLKYIAATAVFLTFTIVAVFLGPLYGFSSMYQNANLWFHLIIPVLAIIESLFLCEERFTRRDNVLVALPPLLYGCVYLCNVLLNGIGEWPETNDWYGFLNWGYPVGILIFACICAVSWLLGRILRISRSGKEQA